MKICPACQSQYSDATLNFCLQDGAHLVDERNQSSIDTVAFSDPVTIKAVSGTHGAINVRPEWSRTSDQYPTVAVASPSPRKFSNAFVATLAVIPVTIALVAGIAVPRIYKPENNKPPTDVPRTESITKEIVHEHDPKSQNPASAEGAKKEVADFVEAWEKAFETRSADKYAVAYAAKVDYLGKPGVMAAAIRSEVQKTFDFFPRVEIEITNLLVAVDDASDAATAVFDKAWSYEANQKLTEGKAHVKIHLQKVDGQWKIVSEKHLKTYYLEN